MNLKRNSAVAEAGFGKVAVVVAVAALMGTLPSVGNVMGKLNGLTSKVAGASQKEAGQTKALLARNLARMPLSFIENRGQISPQISYFIQGAGTSVYFSPEGLSYSLRTKSPTEGSYLLNLSFIGANKVAPVALDKSQATINYFRGSPDQWRTGVPTSSKIQYKDLWPGIDLVYSGTGEKLKYDFNVAPGADPSKIKLAYRNTDAVSVNKKGQLVIESPAGTITDDRPFAFQEQHANKSTVRSAYKLSGNGDGTYGFSLGNYDRSKPLVIDPAVLIHSGFVGGEGVDTGEDVAVDATGAAYITGSTTSTPQSIPAFPATGGPNLNSGGGNDAFVAKVNPAGTALVYAGYIGGSGEDSAFGIGVDSSGAAYVAGTTDSTESSPVAFPLSVGPDLTQNGSRDVFVTKVNPAGTGLDYSGYIGGVGSEGNQADIAVSPAGNAYVVGVSGSDQFTFPVRTGPDLGQNGSDDAFVAKVSLTGNRLDFAGYVGGSGVDSALGVAVDATGAAYVVGQTGSTEATFPDKVGPDLSFNGGTDAFIAKVAPAGNTLTYAGYIGGTSTPDVARAVAVDGSGSAYVIGSTASSAGFPAIVGPDLTFNGTADAFITKVNAAGNNLIYSGFIGGASSDVGQGIAVDATGAAYIAGDTASTETTFPALVGPDLQQEAGKTGEPGSTDGFVAKLSPSGRSFAFSGFLGGDGNDASRDVTVDGFGNVYVAGISGSDETTIAVVGGPDLGYNGGLSDALVSKLTYTAPLERVADFDGNGSTDISLYRNGTWYRQGFPEIGWGGDATDKAVPADYNGDGSTDIAVYRGATGTWWVKDQFTIQWGGDPSDIPVPADYDGDGKADLAVYRNGAWHVRNQFSVNWGGFPANDVPVPADYDGNGVAEIAVYRKATGVWYLRGFSGTNTATATNPALGVVQWGGGGTDVPVPGDYNGDGATDLAVYRKATGDWFIKDLYAVPTTQTTWGGDGSDVPVPGDYDNNGTSDLAVYRVATGYWYIKDQPGVSLGGDPADKALPLPSAIRD